MIHLIGESIYTMSLLKFFLNKVLIRNKTLFWVHSEKEISIDNISLDSINKYKRCSYTNFLCSNNKVSSFHDLDVTLHKQTLKCFPCIVAIRVSLHNLCLFLQMLFTIPVSYCFKMSYNRCIHFAKSIFH